ncbi:hypothetical protein Tco_0403477 [Tanacetum coccineum]
MKYLRNTKDMFLVYGGNIEGELRVTCADWKSAMQITTTMSSTEAEYIVASEATMEAVWIRKIIDGLGVVPTNKERMEMYCENYGAIIIANKPGVHRGAKHYRRKVHYIREVIEEGNFNLLKVHTDDNIADPLTKALPCTKHVNHVRSIGMHPSMAGDGVAGIKRRRRDLSSDGVRNLAMASGRGRLKEDLESSTW